MKSIQDTIGPFENMLSAKIDHMGSIEVRDEARSCLIMFALQSLHSDVLKDAPIVVHWGEMSHVDTSAFRIAARKHAQEFARHEGMLT